MKTIFRDIAILLAYGFCVVICLAVKMYVEAPKAPVFTPTITAPTEAQIKEQVKHEREQRARTRAINHAVAAARMVYHANGCSDRYSDLTGQTAVELGVSARLLAAVIYVESSCRASAVSGRDSIGLMQVNPRVWGHRKELRDPSFNIHKGARILASYIARYGLVEGLHHYNGIGDHSQTYAERVLAAGGITP